MSDTQVYKVRTIIPFDAPREYRKHLLDATRKEVGNRIFDILWTSRLPSVVDIDEKLYTDFKNTPYLNYGHPDEVFEFEITITPVQHRHVTLTKMDGLDMSYFQKEKFLERVKKWIKKKVSR